MKYTVSLFAHRRVQLRSVLHVSIRRSLSCYTRLLPHNFTFSVDKPKTTTIRVGGASGGGGSGSGSGRGRGGRSRS